MKNSDLINQIDVFLEEHRDEFDDAEIENPYRAKFNKLNRKWRFLCNKKDLTREEVEEGQEMAPRLFYLEMIADRWDKILPLEELTKKDEGLKLPNGMSEEHKEIFKKGGFKDV